MRSATQPTLELELDNTLTMLLVAIVSKPAESKDLAQVCLEVEPATVKDPTYLEVAPAMDKATLEHTKVEILALIKVEILAPTRAVHLVPPTKVEPQAALTKAAHPATLTKVEPQVLKVPQAPSPLAELEPLQEQPMDSPPANTIGTEPPMSLLLPKVRAEAARAAPASPTPGTSPNSE